MISVRVPTFGTNPIYLEQALRSVIAAEYFPAFVELAVIENGGPYDAVTEVLKKIGNKNVKRIVFAEKLPVAGNWNRCVDTCEGEWIHILHDDDYISPDFYHDAVKFSGHADKAFDLLACKCEAVGAEGELLGWALGLKQQSGAFERSSNDAICGESLIACVSVLVRRSSYQRLGNFNQRFDYAVDWECWGRIALKGSAYFNSDSKCFYRVHDGNTTTRSKGLLLYGQTQCVAILLRNLFFERYSAYPFSSIVEFPLRHLKRNLMFFRNIRNFKSLLKATIHFTGAYIAKALPQQVREAWYSKPFRRAMHLAAHSWRNSRTRSLEKSKQAMRIGVSVKISPLAQVLGWRNITIGDRSVISDGVCINVNSRGSSNALAIGNGVFVGAYSFFTTGEGIEIGDYCLVGRFCQFINAGHTMNPTTPYVVNGICNYDKLKVGANVWLTNSVVVVGGVSIGYGSIIGAGSLVTREIPPLAIAYGNPAKVRKFYSWSQKSWVKISENEAYRSQLVRHLSQIPSEEEYLSFISGAGFMLRLPTKAIGASQGDIY